MKIWIQFNCLLINHLSDSKNKMVTRGMILKQQSLCAFRLIENSIYMLGWICPKCQSNFVCIMVMERGEVKVKYELGNGLCEMEMKRTAGTN